MTPTGQRAPNEERRDVPGGSQNLRARGGVTSSGGDVGGSGSVGHDGTMRCGMCGEGFGKPEDLDQHLAENHARRKA